MIFKNLSLQIGNAPILQEINATLNRGRLTALIGRNGSGKSSLLACACGQARYQGELLLAGADLQTYSPKEKALQLAMLPQQLPTPSRSVWELCALGRAPHTTLSGKLTPKDRAAIQAALQQAGMEPMADRELATLSGGERQRAFLAMILAQDSPILLLDEPTTYLDMSAAAEFTALLKTLVVEQQKTVLAVLHDLNNAIAYADDLWILDQGKLIYAGATADCLQTDRIEKTFDVRRAQSAERIFFY